MKRRGKGIIAITGEALLDLLRALDGKTLVTINGIPEGAELVDVAVDSDRGLIKLKLWGECGELPLVRECEQIPYLPPLTVEVVPVAVATPKE